MRAVNKTMNASSEIRSFIARIIRLDRKTRLEQMERERKALASKGCKSDGVTPQSIWKLLFLQLRGHPVDELEFIKACASMNPDVKKSGYLGLMFLESPQHVVMLLNTLLKDLHSLEHYATALAFIANYSASDAKHDAKLAQLSGDMKILTETSDNFSRYIIARARLTRRFDMPLISSKTACLLTKIQIYLDGDFTGQITENETAFIVEEVFRTKCKHTLLKILQLCRRLIRRHLIGITERMLEYLKDLLIGPSSKAAKPIDIALSMEVCYLLRESNRFPERAQCFIHRMISSENANSRHMAFSFAAASSTDGASGACDAFHDAVIERIIRLGIHQLNHLPIVLALLNVSNHRTLYSRRDEIVHYVQKDTTDARQSERIVTALLLRIIEFSDFEFLCKILNENPRIYTHIRNKNRLPLDQSRRLFRAVSARDDPDYFLLTYDTIASDTVDSQQILSIATRHVNLICDVSVPESTAVPPGPRPEHGLELSDRLELLDSLFDFLMSHGDLAANRQLLLRTYDLLSADSRRIPPLAPKICQGILLFNLVLQPRLYHISGTLFVSCSVVPGSASLSYRPESIQSVSVYDTDDYTAVSVERVRTEDTEQIVFSTEDRSSVLLTCCTDDGSFRTTILIN